MNALRLPMAHTLAGMQGKYMMGALSAEKQSPSRCNFPQVKILKACPVVLLAPGCLNGHSPEAPVAPDAPVAPEAPVAPVK